jgi:hypothetical protein
MQITVKRLWETDESICGIMLVDGQEESFTLERPRTGDHPCIPAGTYPVILTPSPHLKYVTPELQNVSGRTSIRIHIANKAKELLGCIAVGETHTKNFVGNSHDAFASLMTLLKTSLDPITITIIDPSPSPSET